MALTDEEEELLDHLIQVLKLLENKEYHHQRNTHGAWLYSQVAQEMTILLKSQ